MNYVLHGIASRLSSGGADKQELLRDFVTKCYKPQDYEGNKAIPRSLFLSLSLACSLGCLLARWLACLCYGYEYLVLGLLYTCIHSLTDSPITHSLAHSPSSLIHPPMHSCSHPLSQSVTLIHAPTQSPTCVSDPILCNPGIPLTLKKSKF